MKCRAFAVLLSFFLLMTCFAGVCAAENDAIRAGDIVILYTNDVHTYIQGGEEEGALSYAHVAAMKQDLLAVTDKVLLVDAGDHIQGTAYGAMDQGKTVVELMNMAGYDAATLGNHEFDYTVSGMFNARQWADYPYLSCNFTDLRTESNVLDSYKVFDLDGTRVAILGITTPETLTSTAPAYFQDENGNYIYGIAGGADGAALYAAVQKGIDDARAAGADYVIGLGHLGTDASASPWTSREVIANTQGLTALIDGHSHSAIPAEQVTDKAGNPVLLTQTGSYLDAVGTLRITADGEVSAFLTESYPRTDEAVAAAADQWVKQVDAMLGEMIAESDLDFVINNAAGERLVRIRQTNMADFNADAYYYLLNGIEGLQCDVAVTNGGGVRAEAAAGPWSYKTMKSVNPFGNVICMVRVTGQQLLDALEWAYRLTDGQPGCPEEGTLLHTAGVTFKVDASIEATVQSQDGIWSGGPTGAYRVHDVAVYDRESGGYLPLELEKQYTLAGTNYTLRNLGGGCAMFREAELVKDYIMEDYMAMAAYAVAFKDTDGDGLPNIRSANSPLAQYKGYILNYEEHFPQDRVMIYEKTPATGERLMPVALAAVMLLSLGAVLVLIGRRKNRKNNSIGS